jgi:hypothetical protein
VSSVIPALRSLDVGGCLLSSLARHSLSAPVLRSSPAAEDGKAAGPGVPLFTYEIAAIFGALPAEFFFFFFYILQILYRISVK